MLIKDIIDKRLALLRRQRDYAPPTAKAGYDLRIHELQDLYQILVDVTTPRTIHDCFRIYGVVRKDADKWRMLPPTSGEIHGLPGSRGNIIATNGLLCLIVQNTTLGIKLFEGHLAHFEADEKNEVVENEVATAKAKAERSERKAIAIEKLIEELKDII